MEKDFYDLQLEVATFIATMKEWMVTSVEYRVIHTNRLEDINKKVEVVDSKLDTLIVSLPCKERKGWHDSMNKEETFMRLILTMIMGYIGFGWIKK